MSRLVTPVRAYYSCAEGWLKNLVGVQRAQAEVFVWPGGNVPARTETEPQARFFLRLREAATEDERSGIRNGRKTKS